MGNTKERKFPRSLGLPTATCRSFTLPLFGLDKELPVCLRFAFSRLYSLSTVHHTMQRTCMCAHVFGTYMSFSLPFPSLSLPLSLFILSSLSLFRSREHSCIVSDKQPHMHTIAASERIRFADTRRGPVS